MRWKEGSEYQFDRYVKNPKLKNDLIWGYGSNMCAGRFYAMTFLKTLVLVVLKEFKEIKLVEKGSVELDYAKVGQGK